MSSYQDDMFSPMLKRSIHRQGDLFDVAAATDADSDLTCVQCGANLVRTASDFLACPNGHGKLSEIVAVEPAEGGQLFPDDLPDVPAAPPSFAAGTMRSYARYFKRGK